MRFLRHAVVIGTLLSCVVLAGESASSGSDWPKFQGPFGTGNSPETGLLRSWPKEGPAVIWRVKIKPGWSCPAVVGDRVYVCATESLRGDAETVSCLNTADGKQVWKHTYEVGPYWKRNIGWARGGFRATPVVDGDRIYTLGSIGHLHCLDRHTGKVLWQQNLWDEWRPSGEKGYVFSPLVEDGKLILWYSDGASEARHGDPDPEGHPERHMVLCRALNATTGKPDWEFREPHRMPARMGEGQTPAVADFAGDKCVVVTGNCELKALRIRDGKQVWNLACIRPDRRGTTIPTPLVLPRYILNLPDQEDAHLVELDRQRLDVPAKFVWKKNLETYCAIHQFRHHAGYLYGFTGEIRGGDEKAASESMLHLTCLELATGKVMWSEKGFQNGVAMTEADGLLFVRTYQTLRLIEANSAGYRPRGEVKTHSVWQPTLNLLDLVQPILSRGRLYIRTPEELICYQVKS